MATVDDPLPDEPHAPSEVAIASVARTQLTARGRRVTISQLGIGVGIGRL